MTQQTLRSLVAGAAVAILVMTATPASAAGNSGRTSDVASASSSASSSPESLNFTLDEVVQGIVFSKGPVAQTIDRAVSYPENLTAEELAVVKGVEKRLTNAMITVDEVSLQNAVPQLTSGDPYVVEAGLTVFAESFTAALDREYPGASDTPVRTPRCGLVAVCAAVSVAAIALGAAIAVVAFNVAGAVNIVYNQNGLWNKNGVWNGKKAPIASNPTELVQNYPTLSASEEIRRITLSFRS